MKEQLDQLRDLGGALRTRLPEETFGMVRPLLERFGITRVANVTGLDSVGIPVWTAIRPAARSLSVSQGKGLTDSLAMTSAVMEAIELHHAESCVPDGTEHSIGEAVRSDAFVDPRLLPILSDRSFRESQETRFVEALDYLTGETLKVPREVVELNGLVKNESAGLFRSSSSGLASGNTRDEAILHGLCELVERDQVAFWTVLEGLLSPRPNTRVDLGSVDDRVCKDLVARIQQAGLSVAVWYASVGCEIPTFICTTWDERRHTLYPTLQGGQGTHPSKRVALCRALTESIQSRATFIAGARDDVYWSTYNTELDVSGAGHQSFIQAVKTTACDVDFGSLPEVPKTDGLNVLLQWVVDHVQTRLDTRCLVVDLSEPELPFHVVRVVAPGLDVSPQNHQYTASPRMISYLREHDLL